MTPDHELGSTADVGTQANCARLDALANNRVVELAALPRVSWFDPSEAGTLVPTRDLCFAGVHALGHQVGPNLDPHPLSAYVAVLGQHIETGVELFERVKIAAYRLTLPDLELGKSLYLGRRGLATKQLREDTHEVIL